MGYNFLECDRDQRFLLPPDMREWLPGDHIAFFMLEAVKELDLSRFYASYRSDGWGRAAFHPEMMVALVLYAFSVGERSSRRIERRCVEDVGFRVVAAGHTPDHSTIARFVARHHDALQELFVQVLSLCARAELVRPGTVAVDGTKMAANASRNNNVTQDQLADYARRVFEEAAEIDAEEDRLYGDKRGDELPSHLVDQDRRVEWIKEQLEQIQAQQPDDYDERVAKREAKEKELGRRLSGRKPKPKKPKPARVNTTDPDSRVMKTPTGFVQGYNAQAVATEDQVVIAAVVTNAPTDVGEFKPMVKQAKHNLVLADVEESIGTVVADAGYFSTDNIEADLGVNALIAPVASRDLRAAAEACAHLPAHADEDHDARQQAIEDEITRRVEILERVTARQITTKQASDLLGLSESQTYAVKNRFQARGRDGIRPPLPPASRSPGPQQRMLVRFATEEARATYAKRSVTIEPVFGQTKDARGIRGFLRRGLTGCNTEWTLIMTTHNLRKLAVHRSSRLTPRTSFFSRFLARRILRPVSLAA